MFFDKTNIAQPVAELIHKFDNDNKIMQPVAALIHKFDDDNKIAQPVTKLTLYISFPMTRRLPSQWRELTHKFSDDSKIAQPVGELIHKFVDTPKLPIQWQS